MLPKRDINELEKKCIGKVLNGDVEAFRYFVNTYKDFAYKLSYSILKDQYMAEEAIQESFICAFENLKSFKHEAMFKTWFSRIVINQSLQKTSSNNHKFQKIDTIPDVESNNIDTALQYLCKKERAKYITQTFNCLPPKETLALELFYINEYSLVEINELTRWSQSKIKMLLLRGRKHFRLKLELLLQTEMKEIL